MLGHSDNAREHNEKDCVELLATCHVQVSEYVKERILALREEHSPQYSNIACLRTNAQKYLVNYFRKGQLTKLFFLFPVQCTLQILHTLDEIFKVTALHGRAL